MPLVIMRQDGPPAGGPPPPMALPPPVRLPADPVAAIISITVIMFIVVVVKVGYRQFALKQLGWDDLFATIGALLIIATATVIVTVMTDAGLRSHRLVSPIAIGSPKFVNRLFVFLLLSGIPGGFAKLAILSLLVRVFPKRIRPISAYLSYFGIAITSLFYVITFIYTLAKCVPKNGQSCSVPTQVDIGKAVGIANMVLDTYIMVLSLFNIWSLQLSKKRRMGVSLVFLTGLLSLACSCIVVYYRYTTSTDPNAVWTVVLTPLVLAIYEPSIALIAACLPTYPALWRSAINTRLLSSVRSIISQLSGSRTGGSIELTDQPSNEHLHKPQSSASRAQSKKSQDSIHVNMYSQP